MHAQQFSDICDGSPVLVDQLAGVVDLRRREGRAWPKPDASRFGCIPPAPGAVDDQGTLKLSDAGKHCQDHAARWCSGIGPRFCKAAQASACTLDAFGDVE
jgi:hypothetical protein